MRSDVIVYAFLISVGLHVLLFVPWTSPQKVEKRPETIPVAYRRIAKKETQPPAPTKTKDPTKRAKGLPQPAPPAVVPPRPAPPPPEPTPNPKASKDPVTVAQKSAPPPPPLPKPEPKPKPPSKETAAPTAKKLVPAKEAKELPEQKVVEKKATEPPAKQAKVKKEAVQPKAEEPRKPPKKDVTKKPTQKIEPPEQKQIARKRTPREAKTTAVKKELPTLKELLPPLSGSGRVASGSHGNEYISMDSRDPKYSSWLASLQRDIYRTWLPSYPSADIRGEVLLGLMIKNDGDLVYVEVLRSSGLGMLDRHAMEAVRAAAPFKRFPPWMTQDQQGIKATFTYGGTPGTVRNWAR